MSDKLRGFLSWLCMLLGVVAGLAHYYGLFGGTCFGEPCYRQPWFRMSLIGAGLLIGAIALTALVSLAMKRRQ